MISIKSSALTLSEIVNRANMLGATVETWTNGRMFIEAPKGYSWINNDLHCIAYPTKGLDISQALNSGMKRCDDDCVLCGQNEAPFEAPKGTTFHKTKVKLSLQDVIVEMDSLALVS